MSLQTKSSKNQQSFNNLNNNFREVRFESQGKELKSVATNETAIFHEPEEENPEPILVQSAEHNSYAPDPVDFYRQNYT